MGEPQHKNVHIAGKSKILPEITFIFQKSKWESLLGKSVSLLVFRKYHCDHRKLCA